MKRQVSVTWSLILIVVLAGTLLAACASPTPTPPPLPTATATPRSTPLPAVPTAVPLASADRLLPIYIVPRNNEATDDDAAALTAQIVELTGLNVEVRLAAHDGVVMTTLCSANPAVGWLSGIGFVAAEAQGCADPALQVEQDRATGNAVDMLMNADLVGEIAAAGDMLALAGREFCRLNSQDRVSWLVASLILDNAGVDPLYDLGDVVDVADFDALVTAIYEGDCFGGAVPAGYLDDGVSDELAALEDLAGRVQIVDTSPEIPFGVMVYPQTVPLNVRIPLDDAFAQIASDDAQAEVLAALLGQDDLKRATQEDFETLREFAIGSGLDFTALGE